MDVAEGRNKDRGDRGRGRGGTMIICLCYQASSVSLLTFDLNSFRFPWWPRR